MSSKDATHAGTKGRWDLHSGVGLPNGPTPGASSERSMCLPAVAATRGQRRGKGAPRKLLHWRVCQVCCVEFLCAMDERSLERCQHLTRPQRHSIPQTRWRTAPRRNMSTRLLTFNPTKSGTHRPRDSGEAFTNMYLTRPGCSLLAEVKSAIIMIDRHKRFFAAPPVRPPTTWW